MEAHGALNKKKKKWLLVIEKANMWINNGTAGHSSHSVCVCASQTLINQCAGIPSLDLIFLTKHSSGATEEKSLCSHPPFTGADGKRSLLRVWPSFATIPRMHCYLGWLGQFKPTGATPLPGDHLFGYIQWCMRSSYKCKNMDCQGVFQPNQFISRSKTPVVQWFASVKHNIIPYPDIVMLSEVNIIVCFSPEFAGCYTETSFLNNSPLYLYFCLLVQGYTTTI